MNKSLKIGLLSLGLLVTLFALMFLIDVSTLKQFWNGETKGYLTSIIATCAVVLSYYLYREIFGSRSHGTGETLLHAIDIMHINFMMLVLMPDKYLKDIKIDSEDARKFHNYYLAGLVILSVLIMTLVVPLMGLASKGVEDMPDTWVSQEGVGHNIFAIFFYTLAYLLRIAVFAYWTMVLALGWAKVKPGHKGFILINGKIIATKKPGSGLILLFPVFDFIELWQVEAEVTVIVDLDSDSEPKILTASEQNAIFDLREEKTRFKNKEEIPYSERMLVSRNKVVVILGLEDELKFYEKKVSLAEAKERIKEMVQTARLQTFGKKLVSQITGSLEVARKRIEFTLKKDLESYDGCFKIKNVLIPSIDFEELPTAA